MSEEEVIGHIQEFEDSKHLLTQFVHVQNVRTRFENEISKSFFSKVNPEVNKALNHIENLFYNQT